MKAWHWAALAAGLSAAGAIACREYWKAHHNYEALFSVGYGDVVLDVGAGGWGVPFFIAAARKAGGGGLVIAIEPEPRNLAKVEEKIAREGLSNVRTINKAAWNRRGVVPLYLSWSSSAHSLIPDHNRREMGVEADTLDNMVSELGIARVDFVKMDIEGAELEALEGAECVLSMARKVVIAAYHLRNGEKTYPRVIEFLEARGFQTRVTYPGLVHAWRGEQT